VIENLQVYRVRFDNGASVLSKSDQRPRNSQEANSAPPLFDPTSAAP
jgi:soluble lytic murein transglycosylase